MKKRTNLICTLAAAIIVILLFSSSDVYAESQDGSKKDIAASLNVSTVGPQQPANKTFSAADIGIIPRRGFSIPLSEGLEAFVDLSSPSRKGLSAKDNYTDVRAVFGFHIAVQ